MSTSRNVMQEDSPKLAELTADMLFGDVWERPCLLYTSDAADE